MGSENSQVRIRIMKGGSLGGVCQIGSGQGKSLRVRAVMRKAIFNSNKKGLITQLSSCRMIHMPKFVSYRHKIVLRNN